MLAIAHTRREPRNLARVRSISRQPLDTLQDLLNAIRQSEGDGSHLVKMLGATAARLVDHLGEPPEKIDIRRLLDVRPGLNADLKERRYKRNSIRSYSNYVRVLLQKAKDLGWAECAPEIAAAWQQIRQVVRDTTGCTQVIEAGLCRAEALESELI